MTRPNLCNWIGSMLLVAAASVCIFAADLEDYRTRVERARAGVSVLLDNIALTEAGEVPAEPDAEVFAELRKLLPDSERVEISSVGSVETNNGWFRETLAAAERESDLAKRAVLLSALEQRLGAVSETIHDTQTATAAGRSKDEDKRKLAEILERPEFRRPPRPEEAEKNQPSWLKDFLEWLESWFPKFTPPAGAGEGLASVGGVLQWVLMIAVVLVLGFVLYKLLPLFAPRFRRVVREERAERVILGERIGDDESAQDLFGEAERLAREGDVRGAIRKGYVALLCELSDKRLIGLARHKTNRDYVRDVRQRRDVHERMTALTGKFERHWYGGVEARPDDWEEFRDTCGETLKAI